MRTKKVKRISDFALIAFLKIITGIHKKPEIISL